jgi:hypothetical protein
MSYIQLARPSAPQYILRVPFYEASGAKDPLILLAVASNELGGFHTRQGGHALVTSRALGETIHTAIEFFTWLNIAHRHL